MGRTEAVMVSVKEDRDMTAIERADMERVTLEMHRMAEAALAGRKPRKPRASGNPPSPDTENGQ
jgi:hypothetical protein